MGQNQWYHFGVGEPPILVYFSGDWDVHWVILTHGHLSMGFKTTRFDSFQVCPGADTGFMPGRKKRATYTMESKPEFLSRVSGFHVNLQRLDKCFPPQDQSLFWDLWAFRESNLKRVPSRNHGCPLLTKPTLRGLALLREQDTLPGLSEAESRVFFWFRSCLEDYLAVAHKTSTKMELW